MPEQGRKLALALARRQAMACGERRARLWGHRDDDRRRGILHRGAVPDELLCRRQSLSKHGCMSKTFYIGTH